MAARLHIRKHQVCGAVRDSIPSKYKCKHWCFGSSDKETWSCILLEDIYSQIDHHVVEVMSEFGWFPNTQLLWSPNRAAGLIWTVESCKGSLRSRRSSPWSSEAQRHVPPILSGLTWVVGLVPPEQRAPCEYFILLCAANTHLAALQRNILHLISTNRLFTWMYVQVILVINHNCGKQRWLLRSISTMTSASSERPSCDGLFTHWYYSHHHWGPEHKVLLLQFLSSLASLHFINKQGNYRHEREMRGRGVRAPCVI